MFPLTLAVLIIGVFAILAKGICLLYLINQNIDIPIFIAIISAIGII